MVYTFRVHYNDGEAVESIEAENRKSAEDKLKRRHEGARHQPVLQEYEGMWTGPPSAWAT